MNRLVYDVTTWGFAVLVWIIVVGAAIAMVGIARTMWRQTK